MNSSIRKTSLCIVALLMATIVADGQQVSSQMKMARDSGTFFTRKKEYKKALSWFDESFKSGNTFFADYYNAACAAAQTGQINQAFDYLGKSIDAGFLEKPWVEDDSDLTGLHKDKRWPGIIERFAVLERTIEGKFAQVNGIDPAELIPFQQNRRWGYLYKRTFKILVKPEFLKLGFMNGCAVATYRDACEIHVNPEGKIIEVIYPERGEPTLNFGVTDIDNEGPYALSSADGFKGFKMNAKKEITHFSDLYNKYTPRTWNIKGPYLINGKYYAVTGLNVAGVKEDSVGIIDEEGRVLPGFNFNYKRLSRNDAAKDVWFYYTDKNDKAGFVNPKGERKLAGELLEIDFKTSLFDYAIFREGEIAGVVDFESMTWVIQPKEQKIIKIDGTVSMLCNTLYPQGRKGLSAAYFLMQDESGSYYVDTNLKEYRPK